MSDKPPPRTATGSPPKPDWSALPPPHLLWEGTEEGGMGRPCRVVFAHEWTLPAGAKDWVATPRVIFETREGTAGLGEDLWFEKAAGQIPVAFYAFVRDTLARR